MRLRTLIFLCLLTVGLVPTVLFEAIPHSGALEQEIADVEGRHLVMAKNIGLALDRYQADATQAFETTVRDLLEGDNAEFLKPLIASLDIARTCVADRASGEVLLSVGIEEAACSGRIPSEHLDMLLELARPDRTTFSGVVRGDDGEPEILLVRLFGEHLAYAAMKTDYIVELGSVVSFGHRGHAAIVDQAGRVLAHPSPEWRQNMKDLSGVLPVQKMMARESGVTRFHSEPLGMDMIAGFTWVEATGWGVMVPQPMAELIERADSAQRHAVAGIVSGVVLALLLSWLVSGYLTRPVRRVVDAATRFAEGDRSARVPPPGNGVPLELRELGEQFNGMADAVEDTYEKLAAIAENLARSGGANAYDALVGELSRVLEADVAIFGERDVRIPGRMNTLAAYQDGERTPDFSYDLKGSACEQVLDDDLLIVVDRVQEAFPDFLALADWNARAYVGLPVDAPDGTHIGLLCTIYRRPIRSSDAIVSMMRMTADRIANEWQRRRLEANLRSAIEKSTAANRAKTNFLAHMSHELRTPLNGVIGFAQMLALPNSVTSLAEKKRVEYANDILVSGRHLLALINDILDLSKIEAGELRLNEVRFDLVDVIREAVRISDQGAGETAVTIVEGGGTLPEMVADPRLVRQVLINILGNAVKFNKPGGEVRIEVAQRGDGAIDIAVTDQGIGIAEEDIPVVLEPFGQARREFDVSREGTGLGLSISKEFMELHGGSLEIDSEPDVGTTVHLIFPAWRSGGAGAPSD